MLCFLILLLQACLVLRVLLCRRHIRLLFRSALPSPPSMVSVVSVSPTPFPHSACSRLSYLDTSKLTPAFFCSVYFSSPVFSFQLIFFRPFRRSFVLESSEDAHRTVIQFSFGNQSWLLRALFCYSIRYRVERKKRFSTPPFLPREVQC